MLLQSEKEKRLFCVRYDVVPNKEPFYVPSTSSLHRGADDPTAHGGLPMRIAAEIIHTAGETEASFGGVQLVRDNRLDVR